MEYKQALIIAGKVKKELEPHCERIEIAGSIRRRKDGILRSYVNPDIGLHIFNCAFKIKQKTLA